MSYKVRKYFYNLYWQLISLLWFFTSKSISTLNLQQQYSIGVVTYIDRFDKFFKTLIKHLTFCFPNIEIIVVVNGYYDFEKQKQYLTNIRQFLRRFPNVKIIDFEQPQSLSKLWNLAVINATNEKVFIMNDDIRITPWFQNDLINSNILAEEIALINRTWSHFLISKNTMKEIGYFDERFPGVGNEDEDYECRLVLKDILVKTFKINSVKNVVFKTKNFSYGAETPTVNGKYVKGNKLFFDSKWDTLTTKKDGFKYVEILDLYVKLKAGMETPNFYN